MRNLLLLSTAAAAFGSVLIAQPACAEAADAPATEVDPVIVIGTRSERLASRTPATVSVISADQIETMLATDIKDLIRFEPGVSVPTSPARFNLALSGGGRDSNCQYAGCGRDARRRRHDARCPGCDAGRRWHTGARRNTYPQKHNRNWPADRLRRRSDAFGRHSAGNLRRRSARPTARRRKRADAAVRCIHRLARDRAAKPA